MSMVFQSFALMPHLTAIENAAFGLAVAGIPAAKRRKIALEALEQVGLAAYADRYPHEMSGGMQQRVGLARALANNPTIMLMDEAFSALDPLIRSEMQDELIRIVGETRSTVVMVTHDVDEAVLLSDRIVMMTNGPRATVGEILTTPFGRPRVRGEVLAHPEYYERRERMLRFLEEWERKKPSSAA